MTGTVFAVASGKGGVGKTTTAINLGAMLASAGHEVIVVDTDLGMANVEGYLDFDLDGSTLHEVLAGDANVEDAIYSAPGDIDVLPSSTDIHAFAQSETAKLQQVATQLREEYEYVLLDTGAGISYDTLLPLSLADGVLLVTTPDVAAVRDTAKTAQLTAQVDGTVRGAVITHRSNDILSADDVEGTLDTDVLTVVPDDETVPMGIDAGRPLAVFAPNTVAANAYRELADILTGETDTPKLSGEPSPTDDDAPTFADPEADADAKHSDSEISDSETPESDVSNSEQSDSDATVDTAPDTAPEPDAVHELIDRRVIKTGDPDDEPTVEAVPDDSGSTETEPDDVATTEVFDDSDDEPEFEKSFDELDEVPEGSPESPVESDADDATSPDAANDPDTTSDATPDAEAEQLDEFDTVLTESSEGPEESTDDSTADESGDIPDEIVEAESDDDFDAVPFQDEPVRPEPQNGESADLDETVSPDENEEKSGLFGRIGSLFR